jgi:hypothetical protein
LQVFGLVEGCYQERPLTEGRIWLRELGLGLGVWSGIYQGLERPWLRWYDAEQVWIPTPVEREQREIERERQRAERERRRGEQETQRAERLTAQLRKLGIEPEA